MAPSLMLHLFVRLATLVASPAVLPPPIALVVPVQTIFTMLNV